MGFEGWLVADLTITASLDGSPAINDTSVLDVRDYARTESGVHFLVTEDSIHLAWD